MTFTSSLILTCVLYGITLFLIILLIGSKQKKSRLLSDSDEWLYDHFFQKLYRAIFTKNTDPIELSKSFGLEYDKYMVDCAIIGKEPNFERETMMRVVGTMAFIISLPLSVAFYSPIPLIIGIVAFLLLVSMVPRTTHSAAERKKRQMLAEMPRFIDLLLSALEINLPIDTAIIETANSVPCLLSSELKATFAETQIGAKNWQQALEAIARKYEIDQLSDFVLNIITAYNKGVSVTEVVARESYTVRQSALLAAKERTAKMTSGILFPLVVFKILPLLITLMVPIMQEAFSFYSS